MRVIRADVLEYVRALDGRSYNPVSRWTERRAPLLVLHADNGVTGYGEAWCIQQQIGAVLDGLVASVGESVVGHAFDDVDAILQLAARSRVTDTWTLSAAASAIDQALWDLFAKTREQPLWKALGDAGERQPSYESLSGPGAGQPPGKAPGDAGAGQRMRSARGDVGALVSVYASGGLYRDGAGVEALVDDVAAWRARGFRDVKIKVGGLPLERDIKRIEAVRAAMGQASELWVDAVNQLRPANALAVVEAFRAAGATAIQAPVAIDDYTTMEAINRNGMPVIAGEAEHSSRAFEQLLATGSVGLLQLNLGLCGGYSGAWRIAERAAQHAIPVTVQAHGTAILLAGSLHWGAAAGVYNVEYHRFHDHLADLQGTRKSAIRAGQLHMGDAAGVGTKPLDAGEQPDGGEIRCHRSVRGKVR